MTVGTLRLCYACSRGSVRGFLGRLHFVQYSEGRGADRGRAGGREGGGIISTKEQRRAPRYKYRLKISYVRAPRGADGDLTASSHDVRTRLKGGSVVLNARAARCAMRLN